ncbi:MAG: alanine--tRNA ligase [Gammaproteobacteria bacterium]
MESAALRQLFLSYFADQGHLVEPSSPLVPANDPSLLFTNAGMVQFKEIFLGLAQPKATRVATAQKCIRAGGKHNDLENVGHTARHHTFFEMLGNFSFGDYFKEEAIQLAWNFLVNELRIDPDRLLVTVHQTDEQSADIWRRKIGLAAERIVTLGDQDNFWAMGDTGPCGPSSEIFFDHGPDIAGGRPGSPEADGDRWVEIWNLVFMQYSRTLEGHLDPLPSACVDTGMGLERIVAVMQGKVNNYDTDLFEPLIGQAAHYLSLPSSPADWAPEQLTALRVIADHLRSLAFLSAEGVAPSNEGRGYVMRRILRRAARYCYKLGGREPVLWRMVPVFADHMGAAYPELTASHERIEQVIQSEENQFSLALDRGMKMLDNYVSRHSGKALSGELVFSLHDTYGFPVDMTADFARENGLKWDQVGYELLMEQQRARARVADPFKTHATEGVAALPSTDFSGYEQLQTQGNVLEMWQEGRAVSGLSAGQTGLLALDKSPFYAESGGQIGDTGLLVSQDASRAHLQVLDCQKEGAVHLHQVRVESGAVQTGDQLVAEVDAPRRQAIMRSHSATHLMHAALRQILGNGVAQRGSWVGPDRLRFDFSHASKVSREEQGQVEQIVIEQIQQNSEAQIAVMDHQQALDSGAMALFGEKYGDQVRVLTMGGDFSVELCGGTHVAQTGAIGFFKILSESSVAAGIRRIEALTGDAAFSLYRQRLQNLEDIAAQLKCSTDQVVSRVEQLQKQQKAQQKSGSGWSIRYVQAGSIPLRLVWVDAAENPQQLRKTRSAIDAAIRKEQQMMAPSTADLDPVEILVGVTPSKEVLLQVTVPADWQELTSANSIVQLLIQQIGGKGGGKAHYAQAGGGDWAKWPQAMQALVADLARTVK